VALALPSGHRIIRVEETGSTNTVALDAARTGESSGLWIVARRQTGGRGSRGRQWVSIEGNLLASLLLRDPGPVARLPELTFVAALAVRDAIAGFAAQAASGKSVSLKWPNDILVADRKVSGILLESHEVAGGRAVIIGIGVNCVGHPSDTLHAATDLAAEGIDGDAEAVLASMADRMAFWLETWNGGAGFADVRSAWLKHAKGLGERIHVRLPGRELTGTFEEFSQDGQLVIRLDGRDSIRLSAADIFFANEITNGA
jgi:BirA family biotin operon repressor/biotin-[acetyl-CoA-carboxylase] ligase